MVSNLANTSSATAATVTPSEPDSLPQGVSPAMLALGRAITSLAPTNIPILLVGEPGTGKEVVARQIHRLSRGHEGPFLKLNCASLTLEAIVNTFDTPDTGNSPPAGSSRGTVFLEEVAELALACQSQLLNVLFNGNAAPGEYSSTRRVISATGRNLEEEMRAGRFLEEFFYQINGVSLHLPPLRERKEDIPILVAWFLRKYATLLGHPEPALSPGALRVLQEHSWPGNIRELENVVKKIVALGDEGVALAEVRRSSAAAQPSCGDSMGLSLKEAARAASREAERELILKALARTRWNRKRAAQVLKISYKALLYKLKQIGLDDSAAP